MKYSSEYYQGVLKYHIFDVTQSMNELKQKLSLPGLQQS